MLCTFCHTGNTRLIERTCRIVFDATNPKTDIADCRIEERWLCNTCGNPFTPATSKVAPWHLRRRITGERPKRIPKSEIAKEFFRGL